MANAVLSCQFKLNNYCIFFIYVPNREIILPDPVCDAIYLKIYEEIMLKINIF